MARDPIDDWMDKAIEADLVELDIDEFDGHSGPPLSHEDIEVARVRLARWQGPDAFKAAVDALCARCVSKDWFNRSHQRCCLLHVFREQRLDLL